MVLETIIHPDFQSNFLNLSLLICDLFVGGNFRTAHILYHPEVFDDRILNDIDSACPFQMPRTTIDISAPESAFSNQNQRTDRILQIIFLPPLQLGENMGHNNRIKLYWGCNNHNIEFTFSLSLFLIFFLGEQSNEII